jgi:hypothetical protein
MYTYIYIGRNVHFVMMDVHIDGTVTQGLGAGTQVNFNTVSMTLGNFTQAMRDANTEKVYVYMFV